MVTSCTFCCYGFPSFTFSLPQLLLAINPFHLKTRWKPCMNMFSGLHGNQYSWCSKFHQASSTAEQVSQAAQSGKRRLLQCWAPRATMSCTEKIGSKWVKLNPVSCNPAKYKAARIAWGGPDKSIRTYKNYIVQNHLKLSRTPFTRWMELPRAQLPYFLIAI